MPTRFRGGVSHIYSCFLRFLLVSLVLVSCWKPDETTVSSSKRQHRHDGGTGAPAHPLDGQLLKGNRNGIYYVNGGVRHLVPDFYTFTHMGFNVSAIRKVKDDELSAIPEGDKIAPIPVFRPE